jgi:hypothetical protein
MVKLLFFYQVIVQTHLSINYMSYSTNNFNIVDNINKMDNIKDNIFA